MPLNNNYYSSKEFRSKLEKYEKATENGESLYLEADDLSDIAEYYHGQGDIDAALKTIDHALSIFPGATTPLALRARIALFDKDDANSAKRFAEMIDDKSDEEYYYLNAEIMIYENKSDDADAYLEDKIDKINEDDVDDFILDTADLFLDYFDIEIAEKWLKKSELTDDSDFLDLKGRVAMAKGEYEESEKIFNTLLDKDPFSVPYWNNLASSQLLHDEISKAITSSEFSIAINPENAEGILNKAHGLFGLGNYEEAQKYYKHYTELNPDDESGELALGITFVNLNKYEEAIEHFLKADKLAIKNNNTDSRFEILKEIAFTYSQIDKEKEAIKYVNIMEKLPGCDVNLTLVLKGYICLQHENVKAANKYFNIAVKNSNSNPEILFHISISFYDCGYSDKAYDILKNVLATSGKDWDTGYAYFAICCHDVGDQQGFLKAVKTACERNPDEARSLLSGLFPQGMDTKDYYEYLLKKIGKTE